MRQGLCVVSLGVGKGHQERLPLETALEFETLQWNIVVKINEGVLKTAHNLMDWACC